MQLPPRNLTTFVSEVSSRARQAIDGAQFPVSQKRLMLAAFDEYEKHAAPGDFAQPVGLLYCVFRAWGRQADEQARLVAAACHLLFFGGDLFDDVQDSDRKGKVYEGESMPIAINDALAAIFLCFEVLRQGMELEPDAARKTRFLEAFNRCTVPAMGSQHEQLNASDLSTLDDVLRMYRGKTSSMTLLLECGALLGGCDDATVEKYLVGGDHMAVATQIVDDVRDIYGKDESPDLATRTLTYPLACFFETATVEQRREFEQRLDALPASLPELRESFYEQGVIDRCAQAVEEHRLAFHAVIAGMSNTSAYHRLIVTIVDALASMLYAHEPTTTTAHLWNPRGRFDAAVHAAQSEFLAQMEARGLRGAPSLKPWHLPHFEFNADQGAIFYPDVDGLGEDVLGFHMELFGFDDASDAARFLEKQAPLMIAHEMFHYWRHESGRCTDDAWHEEYAANRLMVGYGRQALPKLLDWSLAFAAAARKRFDDLPSAEVERILRRCHAPAREPRGYEVDPVTASRVHLDMVGALAADRPTLERDMVSLLGWHESAATA